jgi:hypothetical protein
MITLSLFFTQYANKNPLKKIKPTYQMKTNEFLKLD